MPGSNYSEKQFQNDLDELTKMISSYSQSGGMKHSPKKSAKMSAKKSAKMMKKSGGLKKKSPKKKSGGAKRERHLDAEGEPIRSFRVINIAGRDVSNNDKYAIRYYHGTKKNNTPGKAAEHAFSKLCRHTGQKNKNTCKITFTLLETTKGSVHKTWGPYSGKFLKLLESRRITRRDPKTGKKSTYMVHYKPYVVLAANK